MYTRALCVRTDIRFNNIYLYVQYTTKRGQRDHLFWKKNLCHPPCGDSFDVKGLRLCLSYQMRTRRCGGEAIGRWPSEKSATFDVRNIARQFKCISQSLLGCRQKSRAAETRQQPLTPPPNINLSSGSRRSDAFFSISFSSHWIPSLGIALAFHWPGVLWLSKKKKQAHELVVTQKAWCYGSEQQTWTIGTRCFLNTSSPVLQSLLDVFPQNRFLVAMNYSVNESISKITDRQVSKIILTHCLFLKRWSKETLLMIRNRYGTSYGLADRLRFPGSIDNGNRLTCGFLLSQRGFFSFYRPSVFFSSDIKS